MFKSAFLKFCELVLRTYEFYLIGEIVYEWFLRTVLNLHGPRTFFIDYELESLWLSRWLSWLKSSADPLIEETRWTRFSFKASIGAI